MKRALFIISLFMYTFSYGQGSPFYYAEYKMESLERDSSYKSKDTKKIEDRINYRNSILGQLNNKLKIEQQNLENEPIKGEFEDESTYRNRLNSRKELISKINKEISRQIKENNDDLQEIEKNNKLNSELIKDIKMYKELSKPSDTLLIDSISRYNAEHKQFDIYCKEKKYQLNMSMDIAKEFKPTFKNVPLYKWNNENWFNYKKKWYKLFEYSTMDFGDKTYKTVVMGNQEWMNEDLRYTFPDKFNVKSKESGPSSKYFIYNLNVVNALNKTELPIGWRLPSKKDWETFKVYFDLVDKEKTYKFNAAFFSYWSSTISASDSKIICTAYILNSHKHMSFSCGERLEEFGEARNANCIRLVRDISN